MIMSELIDKLNWRYAAKRMTGEVVPQDKLDNILEAIKLAPSSAGMQPYNVLVIDNKEVKEKIFEIANNQPQILESSHLLVFAAWEKITVESLDKYMNLIATTRGVTLDSLAVFHSRISGGILSRSEEVNFDWAARQAYIALGHALVAAATEQVDATPMEGFNAAALDEIFGLKEKGLKSVVIMTLGYRDVENDPYVKAKKVRRPNEEFFINV
jgi:nitroreductase/dihydropteridine reductase